MLVSAIFSLAAVQKAFLDLKKGCAVQRARLCVWATGAGLEEDHKRRTCAASTVPCTTSATKAQLLRGEECSSGTQCVHICCTALLTFLQHRLSLQIYRHITSLQHGKPMSSTVHAVHSCRQQESATRARPHQPGGPHMYERNYACELIIRLTCRCHDGKQSKWLTLGTQRQATYCDTSSSSCMGQHGRMATCHTTSAYKVCMYACAQDTGPSGRSSGCRALQAF